MFDNRSYVKAVRVSEFGEQRFRSFDILARKIGVLRLPDGSFKAFESRCKHQGADLAQGPLVGDRVTCPRHGWIYDLGSGECVNTDSLPLRPHALKIDGDWILVATAPDEVVPQLDFEFFKIT